MIEWDCYIMGDDFHRLVDIPHTKILSSQVQIF